MLKRDEITPYLAVSAALHVIVFLAVVFYYNKTKPIFISAPIDVTFYTPAERRVDTPKVEAKEEKAKQEAVKEEVKEEPKTKDDIVVKNKEKPKPKETPKPKPEPKKEEPKKEEPKPAANNGVQTVQAPASSEVKYEAVGSQYDGLSFDTANFKYAYYTNTIVRKIWQYWQWAESYGRLRAVVYFKILRDGSVTSIAVTEPSGNEEFDNTAVRAIQRAGRFAPLPDEYGGDSLGVHFEFKYRN